MTYQLIYKLIVYVFIMDTSVKNIQQVKSDNFKRCSIFLDACQVSSSENWNEIRFIKLIQFAFK